MGVVIILHSFANITISPRSAPGHSAVLKKESICRRHWGDCFNYRTSYPLCAVLFRKGKGEMFRKIFLLH